MAEYFVFLYFLDGLVNVTVTLKWYFNLHLLCVCSTTTSDDLGLALS